MKELITISICLCLSISAWARLGMTSKECEKKYGSPVSEGFDYGKRPKLAKYVKITQKLYQLNSSYKDKYSIYLHICFINDKAELIAYCKYKKDSDDEDQRPELFSVPKYASLPSFSYEEMRQMNKVNKFDSSSPLYNYNNTSKVGGYSIWSLDSAVNSCFLNLPVSMHHGVTKKNNTVTFYCFPGLGISIYYTEKLVDFYNVIARQEADERTKKEKNKVDKINF